MKTMEEMGRMAERCGQRLEEMGYESVVGEWKGKGRRGEGGGSGRGWDGMGAVVSEYTYEEAEKGVTVFSGIPSLPEDFPKPTVFKERTPQHVFRRRIAAQK